MNHVKRIRWGVLFFWLVYISIVSLAYLKLLRWLVR